MAIGTNIVFAKAGVDLVAVFLPEFKGYSGAVVPSEMLIDDKQISDEALASEPKCSLLDTCWDTVGKRRTTR